MIGRPSHRHPLPWPWLLTLALPLVVCTGCRDRAAAAANNKAAPEPKAVTLVPVQTQSADRFIEITGTLYGEEEVSIAAEVPGRVVEIQADLGDVVPHGGLLAKISPTDYQLAVDEQQAALLASLAKLGLDQLPEGEIDLTTLPVVARAQAQESNAKARLERARKLYDRTPPLISEQDYADIQTQLEVASTTASVEKLSAQSLIAEARVRASALRTAQQRLADTIVIAPKEHPLSYRVASRRVSVGEIVAEGEALYRLVASDRVKFRGLVPERYASQVAAGAKATLIVDAFPAPFEAKVSRVAPAVDVATRSFEVEIEAPNPEGKLKPGSFVRARILVTTQNDARFVPDSAVSQFAGVQRVYAVKEGKVTEHRVQVGDLRDGMRELLVPLPGVESVIDMPRGLKEGTPVTTAGRSAAASSPATPAADPGSPVSPATKR